jgi:predicted dehydrogenase
MRLRLGLIGLGNAWERRYRPALRALADRFEVRGVCDPVAHRAELVASEFGATSVDGFQVLVQREDIDALLLLATGWYGSLPVLAACETGKALYLGSGWDVKSDEVRRINGRVEAAGIACMAGLPRRQSPATLRLKELTATSLGAPRLLFCHRRLSRPKRRCGPPRRTGRRSIERELAELVDWCRYLVGSDPSSVTGMTWHGGRARGEDYRMMSLHFSERDQPGSGPVAQISCGRYIPAQWAEAVTYRPLAALQISCERGIAFVDLPASLVWFDEAGRHQESLEDECPVGEQLLAQFHRIATGSCAKTASSLDDVYRALFIVEQAAKSHRQGQRIAL